MGLFSAIASIFSGGQKAKAAKQASDAQVAAAQQGIGAITDQNALNQTNIQQALAGLQPFLQAGQKASGAEGDLVGLNGNDPQAAAIAALQASPLYQSLMQNGQNTILANGSATGGLRTGTMQHNLASFGSDTLAQVIQNQLANLGGISGQGLSAAGTGANTTLGGAQLGANAAGNIATLFGDQGAAQAGGILGKLAGHLQQTGGVVSGLEQVLGNLNFSGSGQAGGQTGMQAIGQTLQRFI